MSAMALPASPIHPLTAAAVMRDPGAELHFVRIGLICREIAAQLHLPNGTQQLILDTIPMHDLGKLAVPDAILSKPGRLTEAEFDLVKQHTIIGHRMLCQSDSRKLQVAAMIALTHHERFDGTGYPYGLKGEEIPLLGRICAIGDVFDALISKRPYKEAWPVDRAVAQIVAASGTHFDPEVVYAFQRALGDIGAQLEPGERHIRQRASARRSLHLVTSATQP